jgi:5-formyltetrahydrofolate cyclo-ligase
VTDVSKNDLRRQARAVRRSITIDGATAAQAITRAFLERVPWQSCRVIAGYWPISEEADVRPLLEALGRQGCQLTLPVVPAPRQPLLFRRWSPGAPLEAGFHGTFQPLPESPLLRPDLVLVPLLAFDRGGSRLGYGGGYYDRTLAALRAQGPLLAVGIAFSAQEVAVLPRESHDQGLDWIVTEVSAREMGP